MTLPRPPDKIGSASRIFGHERTRESIRPYAAAIPRFYAAAATTTAAPSAVYASTDFARATQRRRRVRVRTATKATHLHAASGSACKEECVTVDPRGLRMPDADHHCYRNHFDRYLSGEAKGYRIQKRL
ncbi:MAG: hypothetical protein QOG12_2256 [Verrucomicrobiota bacterium]